MVLSSAEQALENQHFGGLQSASRSFARVQTAAEANLLERLCLALVAAVATTLLALCGAAEAAVRKLGEAQPSPYN